jgi:Na+(H+)/acetate symporter ActP
MTRMQKSATAIVALNLLANAAHGLSHARSEVPLDAWQKTFVAVVVFLLPVLALALYWTPFPRAGALLLAASMLGSLVFGVYFHFIAETSDHVSHRQADLDGRFFVITAGLLIPAALVGTVFGWWSWRRLAPQNSLGKQDTTPFSAPPW